MRRRVPLQVAYVLRAFPRLSETFIVGEILALRGRGVGVRIYALERVEETRRHPSVERILPEVRWVPRGTSTARDIGRRARRLAERRVHLAAGRWIGRDLARSGIAHIHAHFAGPAATAASAAAEASGLPFSFTAHAKDIFAQSVDWKWVREISRRAATVVTVCDYNRRYLVRRLPPGCRVVRIYNGVDVGRWSAGHARRATRASALILAVGRLVRKKGFHVLVAAMAHLRDRGLPSRAVVVGEGVERAALERQIEALGLARTVRLLGARTQPEVRRLIRTASVVCLPSVVDADGNQDALPTALIEAAACGIPAVGTRVAGIPEIVRHGTTGLLVPPGDVAALARALERVLESPALARRLGRMGRLRAEERFDGRRAAELLERLFARASHRARRDRGKEEWRARRVALP